jgi:hypothetical protein
MKTVTTSGSYAHNGATIGFEYEFPVFENVQDAVANMGEAKVLSLIQRMVKVDAGNQSRLKAQIANGHAAARVMSEEQKASLKAKRKADAALIAALKAKGISLEDIANL